MTDNVPGTAPDPVPGPTPPPAPDTAPTVPLTAPTAEVPRPGAAPTAEVPRTSPGSAGSPATHPHTGPRTGPTAVVDSGPFTHSVPPAPPVPPAVPVPTRTSAEVPDLSWPKRSPGLLGAANVLVSGLLGVFWLWIPVVMFFTGIGGLLALGSGLLALAVWFFLQRGLNHLERVRAEAIYADRIPVPQTRRSTRGGAGGWFENQWFVLRSAAFWRSTAHHYVKALYGAFVCGLVLVGISVGAQLLATGINPAAQVVNGLGISFGGDARGIVNQVLNAGLGVVLLVGSLAVLWFSAYLDRGLDRGLLPPTRSGVLQEEVTTLDRARTGALEAATTERLRIERDLHDGVQPMLVALSMKLGMAKAKFDKDPAKAKELLTEAHADSKTAITELRQLARGIHPAVLTDRGLDAAVSAIAGRSPIPVDVHIDLPRRPGAEAESVAYFVVAEALTNIQKHSGATRARVNIVGRRGPAAGGAAGTGASRGTVQISVSDNGHGGAHVVRDGSHTGLAGLADRVTAAKGTWSFTSPLGGPTTIVVEVPCEW